MLDSLFSVDTLWWTLVVLYVPACFGLIIIVLLQKGKGSGFAGAFGVGAGPGSDTVFGPKSARSLPVKLTYVAAAVFMLIAIVMSLIAGSVGKGSAPELIEAAEMESMPAAEGGLSDLGIGTGRAGAADEMAVEEAAPAPGEPVELEVVPAEGDTAASDSASAGEEPAADTP